MQPNFKRSLRRNLALAVSAVAMASVPQMAWAQDQGDTEASDQSETDESLIIVTATRREKRFTEVPAAVSTLDTNETIAQGIVDINALADFAPGLTAVDGGSPGLGNLVIRGIYAGGAPTVGTYIDDIPFGGVVGGFAANTALDATLYDLERVEIIRGPQGTLFGASSVGGVVRYVTRDPDLNDIEGYGFVDASATEGGGENALLKGRVSVPVVEDVLAVSASGFYQDTGGYIDNAITGEKNIDSSEFYGFRLAAKLRVSDFVTLKASYMQHQADFDSASFETFDPTTDTPVFGPLQTEFAAPRKIEFDVFAFNADIDLGFADLTSITSFQTNVLTNTTDVTPTFGPIADAFSPGTAPNTVGFVSGDDTDRFTQEVRLTSKSGGSIEWLIGAYFTEQDSVSFQITDVTPGDVELVTLNTGQQFEEFAVFGNLTYYITPDWEVTGGIRYSDTENTIDQSFTGALSNPLLNNLETVQTDDVVTLLFNTRYRVSDALNIYARVADGYRPGGANLVIDLMGTQIGQPNFQPDDLWSYEAGIKGAILNGRVVYDVGVFFVDWDDAQIATVNAAGLGGIGNAQNTVEVTGFEASLSGEIIDNLTISASLAVTDTEITADEPGLDAVAGDNLAGIPDYTLSLTADYTIPINDDTRIVLGSTWRATGEYNSAYTNSPTGNFVNDDYSQFDFRVGLRTGRIMINAYVTNVGNSDAYQTVFPQSPTVAFGVPLRPRTYGVNTRIDF
ncbi:MAG: TonB-dependent receptor [Pseudomonadota bacterium]